jgi:hypothetical protein
MHALFNQCLLKFTDIFFWCNGWWRFFVMYILLFCKCKRWRWSQSLSLSIQFITSLMLSNDLLISGVSSLHISSFLLSSYFQHATLSPTLEGLFRSSCRETMVSPLQITDHVQGHITHSVCPTKCSHLLSQ